MIIRSKILSSFSLWAIYSFLNYICVR